MKLESQKIVDYLKESIDLVNRHDPKLEREYSRGVLFGLQHSLQYVEELERIYGGIQHDN